MNWCSDPEHLQFCVETNLPATSLWQGLCYLQEISKVYVSVCGKGVSPTICYSRGKMMMYYGILGYHIFRQTHINGMPWIGWRETENHTVFTCPMVKKWYKYVYIYTYLWDGHLSHNGNPYDIYIYIPINAWWPSPKWHITFTFDSTLAEAMTQRQLLTGPIPSTMIYPQAICPRHSLLFTLQKRINMDKRKWLLLPTSILSTFANYLYFQLSCPTKNTHRTSSEWPRKVSMHCPLFTSHSLQLRS